MDIHKEFLSSWESEFRKNIGDIQVKLKSGEIKNVISLLLCKESEVFTKMCKGWKEEEDKLIILDSFEDKTVTYVLEWIYYRKPFNYETNFLDDKEDISKYVAGWFELLRFAEVYDMIKLKLAMTNNIINGINIFNVFEILGNASDSQNNSFCLIIQEKCMEFMLKVLIFYFDLTRFGIIRTCVDGILPVILFPKLDKHVSLCCLHCDSKPKLTTKLDTTHYACTRDRHGINFYCCKHRKDDEVAISLKQLISDKRMKIVINKCMTKINDWFKNLPKKKYTELMEALLKESANILLPIDIEVKN